jgi:hypothetical protein
MADGKGMSISISPYVYKGKGWKADSQDGHLDQSRAG